MTFTYNEKDFLMDGKPYYIISGTIHYFRVPKAYWYDRLLKLKECGFNTVETYTAWNLHEQKEGVFDFSGELDIEEFILTAKELGLNASLCLGIPGKVSPKASAKILADMVLNNIYL